MNVEVKVVRQIYIDGKLFICRKTPTEISQIISTHYNIQESNLFGRNGKSPIADAKKIHEWLLQTVLGFKYTTIAEWLGVNHSTVITNVKTLNNLIDSGDEQVIQNLTEIIKQLK